MTLARTNSNSALSRAAATHQNAMVSRLSSRRMSGIPDLRFDRRTDKWHDRNADPNPNFNSSLS
jgi:hypothetical protein